MSWFARQYVPEAATMLSLGAADMAAQSSHPDFGYLVLLVFEAVLEVVFVSLPGYIVARAGMFDGEAQKMVANLNVMVFTPCLIFTKLASKLSLEKMAELAVIPVIFLLQTLVSYLCATLVSKAFRFKKRPRNFVIAMGVFGNSNSLPISLVLSLSHTISGLHWDRIPGDNDADVAARGILYLMIFQQLGQLLRWSWGFNVLLKPAEAYTVEEGGTLDAIQDRYYDEPDEIATPPLHNRTQGSSTLDGSGDESSAEDNDYFPPVLTNGHKVHDIYSAPVIAPMPTTPTPGDSIYTSHGEHNPHALYRRASLNAQRRRARRPSLLMRTTQLGRRRVSSMQSYSSRKLSPVFHALPVPLQTVLRFVWRYSARFIGGVWEFMNPPLWAMLAAIVVASVPRLQHLFFERGTFINNSITSALEQSAGVAVPIILTVLGANLARSTTSDDEEETPITDLANGEPASARRKLEQHLLIASLLSRLVLPLLVIAPLLALAAKYIPVSILDDPIFIVVCFLLTGAPSALQLAQICQINGVYMGSISRLLFQSYVVWLLPSTLVLVTCALKALQWAEE